MTNLGIVETLILLVVCVGSFILPVATLVLTYLIYNRVRQIEEKLK